MKVSKKVGRHKRVSSVSVSRRRLRNRNKKHTHTQKGGKRGRVHKRVRTYKHGKRFHRGGKDMPLFGSPDPARFDPSTETIKNLRYIRVIDGVRKDKYDDFGIKITRGSDGKYTITFTKKGGDSKFSFSFGPYELQTLQEQVDAAIRNGRVLMNIINADGSEHTDATYIFKEDPELAGIIRDYIYDQSLPSSSRG